MRTVYNRFPAAFLFAALAVVAGAVAGCDSGVPPDEATDDGPTTVQFGTAELSALEAASPTLEIPVTIRNPGDASVTAEVLFAAASSDDAFTLADLGLTLDESRAFRTDDGDLSAYVVATVTFPAGAEDGATQTVEVGIADEDEEGQESGVFALQGLSGGARLGEPSTLTLTIEAEGTQTLVSESFDDEDLAPFTAVNVAGSANWGIGSRDDTPNSPYAEANAFGADAPSNDWLISPALDFTSVGGETLTFLNATNFDDAGLDGEALRVLVSTNYDGGDPTAADWTDISDRVTYSGGGFEFVSSGEVDLSDFDGEAVYVAFQYISTGTGGGSSELWRVDDIVITAQGGGSGDEDDGGGEED